MVAFFTVLTIGEVFLISCVYIFAWNKMARLDDHFAEVFVGFCNAFLAVGITAMRLLYGEYESNVFYGFVTGQKLEPITSFQKILYIV